MRSDQLRFVSGTRMNLPSRVMNVTTEIMDGINFLVAIGGG
jgi:hypothetical protein